MGSLHQPHDYAPCFPPAFVISSKIHAQVERQCNGPLEFANPYIRSDRLIPLRFRCDSTPSLQWIGCLSCCCLLPLFTIVFIIMVNSNTMVSKSPWPLKWDLFCKCWISYSWRKASSTKPFSGCHDLSTFLKLLCSSYISDVIWLSLYTEL